MNYLAENIVLTCVLLHKYPLDTQSKGNCYGGRKKHLIMAMENITSLIDSV